MAVDLIGTRTPLAEVCNGTPEPWGLRVVELEPTPC